MTRRGVHDLSGKQLQRLTIARAIASGPDLIDTDGRATELAELWPRDHVGHTTPNRPQPLCTPVAFSKIRASPASSGAESACKPEGGWPMISSARWASTIPW